MSEIVSIFDGKSIVCQFNGKINQFSRWMSFLQHIRCYWTPNAFISIFLLFALHCSKRSNQFDVQFHSQSAKKNGSLSYHKTKCGNFSHLVKLTRQFKCLFERCFSVHSIYRRDLGVRSIDVILQPISQNI